MPTSNLPENPPEITGGNAVDPFNIDGLRLSQDFGAELGVERVYTSIPVRKPHRQDYFRVRPEEAYRLDLAVVELAEDREIYALAPNCRAELFSEAVAVRLHTAITRQGTLFLWPCKLPSPDGRRNEWRTSALAAAELAMSRWVRIVPDMGLGGYQVFKGAADLSEPEWPSLSFQELLRIAFRERMIDRADHPVLRRLQGLI
jgi:hypothetical protein